MKLICLLSIFTGFIFSLYSQVYNNLEYTWSRQAGGNGAVLSSSTPQNLSSRNKIVKTDGSDNVFVAFSFSGQVDLNASGGGDLRTSVGGYDIVLSKYDQNGNYLWSEVIGGSGDDIVFDIAIDGLGRVALVGNFQSSVDFDPSLGGVSILTATSGTSGTLSAWAAFTALYDNNGNYLWSRSVTGGTPASYGEFTNTSVAFGSFGTVYVTGGGETFGIPPDFDPGTAVVNHDSDQYWIRYSTGGTYISSFGIVTDYDNALRSVLKVSGGVVYTVYYFRGSSVDHNPTVGINNIPSPFVSGNYQYGVAMSRINEIGFSYLGTTTYHISEPVRLDMAINSSNEVFIVGSFAGQFVVSGNSLNSPGINSGYLIKTNALGVPLLSDTYSVSGLQIVNNVEITSNAYGEDIWINYYTNQNSGVYNAGNNVIKLDADLNYIYHENFADGGVGRFMQDIEVNDNEGSLYLTAHLLGSADMDPNSGVAYHSELVNNYPQNDMVLAKYYNCRVASTSYSNEVSCLSDSYQLSSSAGLFYDWSGPNGFSSTDAQPTISNISLLNEGEYVLFSSPGMCQYQIDTIDLTVEQAVDITTIGISDYNPCIGDDIYFLSDSIGGMTFLWTGPAGFSSTEASPEIQGVQYSNSGTYNYIVMNSNNGCQYRTEVDLLVDPCGLPVELAYLSVKCINQNTLIEWITASEYNNDYFEIQKMRDGQFVTVAIVPGMGTITHSTKYEYLDESNVDSGYYRLKQVDYNGDISYSNAIFSNCENKSFSVIKSNGYIAVLGTVSDNLELLDMSGRIIKSANSTLINVEGIAPGIYILRDRLNPELSMKFEL